MKYCICGAENPSNAKTCSYCGRDLTNVKSDGTDDLEYEQPRSGKTKGGRTVIIKEKIAADAVPIRNMWRPSKNERSKYIG